MSKNSKGRLFAGLILMVAAICILLAMPAKAANISDSTYASALQSLGILRGSQQGMQLERTPARAEALVMLIRLLGEEKNATEQKYSHPFTDGGWATDYIGYGYEKKLVSGITETKFGGGQSITLNQYCTFLLRALGYTEGAGGDFTYNNAADFACLTLGGDKQRMAQPFTRGTMAYLSYLTLETRPKDGDTRLGRSLQKSGVYTEKAWADAEKSCRGLAEEIQSTTVLMYAIGSDLESQQGRLTADLDEIMRSKPEGALNVLIQTGGTKSYQNLWMTGGKAERLAVNAQGVNKLGQVFEKATEGKTLTDFIQWGVKQAPADRYMLVLWDHGFGFWGGFGRDDLDGGASMPVSDLCKAVENAKVHFDIIAFDACLMGGVETAYGLRNCADYLIASEQSTPACGLYYTTWLETLCRAPKIGTPELGRLILDSFTVHAGIEANIPTTMAMLRLSHMQSLVTELTDFMGQTEDKNAKAALKKSIEQATLLGKQDGNFDQFDIVEVVKNSGLPRTSRVMAATAAVVCEHSRSSATQDYGGLAIYLPRDLPMREEELKKLGISEKYIGYLGGLK